MGKTERSAKGSRTGQSGDESGREETSQQKSEKRLLGPVDLHEKMSQHSVALWEYTPAIVINFIEKTMKI